MKTGVLFVCLGNICRSPTAEAVFRHLVQEAGLDEQVRVDSAGTGTWHRDEPPDERSCQAAAARGYDMRMLRARTVQAEDFEQFDHILAMDQQNLRALEALRPAGWKGRLGLLLDHAPQLGEREVPDPYYGGPHGFDRVLDLIEEASRELLQELLPSLQSGTPHAKAP